MKHSLLVATALALCPIVAPFLSGCGVGSAISAAEAANNVSRNGVGFSASLIAPAAGALTAGGATGAVSTGTSTDNAGAAPAVIAVPVVSIPTVPLAPAPPLPVTPSPTPPDTSTSSGVTAGPPGSVSSAGSTGSSTGTLTVPPVSTVPVPPAAPPLASSPSLAPVAVLNGQAEQNAASNFSTGQVTTLDILVKVSSGGAGKMGIVMTTAPQLTSELFWSLSAGGVHPVGQSSDTAIGATIIIPSAGHFTLADSDPGDPTRTYLGSVVNAVDPTASPAQNTQVFVKQFRAMLATGKPIYTYIGATNPSVTVESLDISGKIKPSL